MKAYVDNGVYKAVLNEEEDMSNQWVASYLQVYNGAIDGTGNPHKYNWSTTIASYLPNDGQQYEILCEEYASGTVNVRIDTDFANDLSAFYNAGTNATVRNTLLVIGAGRTLRLRSYASTSTYWLTFLAYRKVGSTTYSALNI